VNLTQKSAFAKALQRLSPPHIRHGFRPLYHQSSDNCQICHILPYFALIRDSHRMLQHRTIST
jgi:hypothetical protein